ncbi:MAG: insulinase family protein [Bacteroidales bacterium]|nr:insulinase family protein [Bacteroidales bacterium]
MKRVNFILSGLIVCVLISQFQANATANSSDDKELKYGFKLIEKRFVKEVNAVCYYYEHVQSGAKLLKIANDDPNKTFDITFHTIPDNDCGTAHIMEHSVLNGSENFPAKSPFDVLVKGSLNTFLNAMTSKDRTSYPVASMNDKDYFNLMHVYLDAVFKPMLHKEKRILMQEGWHYDLTSLDAELQYKGVVYGEMKGVYSNPARYLSLYTYRNLFPESEYGYESGGYPSAIPHLTYEQFTDFHKKFYHPDNSYILLYGNGDVDKELAFIHENYLKDYKKRGPQRKIKTQKPFSEMKVVKEYYPVIEGSPIEDQAYLTLQFVNNYGKDKMKTEALSLLMYYLVNSEAAPVRLALQEAGIGKNVGGGSSDYKQNVISITVQKANESQLAEFKEIVIKTLTNIAKTGIDKKELESILNRFEFHRREDNDAQKGITMMYSVMPDFIYNDDPFLGLEYEATLKKLRENLKTNYFEDLILSAFINNPHSLLLSMAPKPGMDKQIAQAEKDELEKYRKTLNESDLQKLVTETQDLLQYQNVEDSPEDLAKIPMLQLSDINPKATFYKAAATKMGDVPVLHYNDHTNGIVYLNMYFDMRTIDKSDLPYIELLSNMLGSLNTESYNFGQLDMEINKSTGGINTNLSRYLVKNDDNQLIPKFVVSSKATAPNLSTMLKLVDEIINKSKFDDTERLKTLLTRHLSSLDARFKREGAYLASYRFSSYISQSGMFGELTGGYEYYSFIENLVKNFDSQSKDLVSKFAEISNKLFVSENVIYGVTCNTEDYKLLTKELSAFQKTLNKANVVLNDWHFDLKVKNEGIMSASKVQYVYSGANFKSLGYKFSGKMLVFNKIISRDYLNQQIRVKGGAYGGFSNLSSSGSLVFASYRDPNLAETYQIYKSMPEFVASYTPSERELTQYIIGTISDLDQPLNVSGKGNQAFSRYFSDLEDSYYQQLRDEVLSTTADDLKKFKPMIEKIVTEKQLCVYGNAQKIEANKDLFDALIKMN